MQRKYLQNNTLLNGGIRAIPFGNLEGRAEWIRSRKKKHREGSWRIAKIYIKTQGATPSYHAICMCVLMMHGRYE